MRNSSILALGFAASLYGETRFARIGEMDGAVDVQAPRGAWRTALRNMPAGERFWIRTGAGAKVEIELDEGSVLRLGPDSLAEFSDYTRLSTGQRITLLSLDRGIAYFTGSPAAGDAAVLAVPGAQVNLRRGTRLRIEAGEEWSKIAVFEGNPALISPAAELDLKEGRMARVSPSRRDKFFLYSEIPELDTDRWSESRDKALAGVNLRRFPDLPYGMADLESAGVWIESSRYGAVWKPPAVENWTPFREGKWLWYEGLGYTWIAAERWGWLPYHHGRWVDGGEGLGWLWAPSKEPGFQAGDVYWMRAPGMAGWGPLAPGEDWRGRALPSLFLNARTTFARYAPDAIEIDPGGFSGRPKDPLAEAAFTVSLPAVTVAAAPAARPATRVGSTRILPLLAGLACETPAPVAVSAAEPAAQRPPEPAPEVIVAAPIPVPAALPAQPVPVETYYVAPVYTGVIVLNPPERRHRAEPKAAAKPREPAKPATPPDARQSAAPATARIPRNDDRMQRNSEPATEPEAPRTERNTRRNQ